MTKHFVAACLLALGTATAAAQTLFTYGNDTVTVPEFLTAYHKNNAGSNKAAAKKEYLDLYIVSRLKIKEARERGYHNQPHLQAELASLREQILPSYLKDEVAVDKLANEALQRAQKDIDLSHIFIALTQDGIKDTAAARQKAFETFLQLQQGKPFAEVAKRFSDDPSAKNNGGKIGFVTAFTLPYELENLAYSTPAGTFSKPYLSKSGYHIFKNEGERKAWGRMRIAQILLLFPPNTDAAFEATLQKKADSIYNRLAKGDDFARLATQFSDDPVSAQAGGQVPEFGIGQYDPLFEQTVFSLPKDGAISKPFKTAHGYHIVKRLAKIPVTTDAQSLQAMRTNVEASEDRMAMAQAALVKKILATTGLQNGTYNEADLWAYSDSVLDGKTGTKQLTLKDETILFNIGATNATIADWIGYAQTARYKSDGSGIKPYAQVWNDFVQYMALAHYKEHMEQYNPMFRQQLQEFEEGSLFFEIMQREVWNKAQADTMALQDYYNRNKAKYVWQQSADAVLFYAPDATTTKTLHAALTKTPKAWRTLVADNNNGAVADSGRFEKEQIPGVAKGTLKAGSLTQPQLNKADNSYAFAYIVKVYTQPAQRTFAEARSLVMNDYQAELEREWVKTLKEKYPVRINQQALETALKEAGK